MRFRRTRRRAGSRPTGLRGSGNPDTSGHESEEPGFRRAPALGANCRSWSFLCRVAHSVGCVQAVYPTVRPPPVTSFTGYDVR